jgi:Protein of unknown function (DUF3757)
MLKMKVSVCILGLVAVGSVSNAKESMYPLLQPQEQRTITTQCPDPQTSSLSWGEIPEPWELSPFSPDIPQADPLTSFKKANILVAGYGHGISCTYRESQGYYTIWWQTKVRIPSFNEPYWAKTLGGYVCSMGVPECQFLPIDE